MTTSRRLLAEFWTGRVIGASVLFVAGIGLLAYGSHVHLSVSAQLRTGHCAGCSPWHPLFVVAPLVVGGILLFLAGGLVYRR